MRPCARGAAYTAGGHVKEQVDGAVAVAEREDVAQLLASGTRALVNDGDLRAARLRFEAAYRTADRTGDADAMAEAALGLGGLWVHEYRTAVGATSLAERLGRALSLVGQHSPLALRLRIRLAGEESYRTGDPAPILAVLAEAGTADEPIARAEALSIAHHCLLGPEHSTARRTLAAELIVESLRTGRRSDRLMGLLWQSVDMLHDGDPHAGRRLGELRELLAEQDHLAVSFVADAIEVMLAIRAGDLDRAEALAGAAAERGRQVGDADATWWYGAQLVAIRWYQGRLAEVRPMLSELVDSPTLSAVDNSAQAALAVAAAVAGDLPAATSALAMLAGADLGDLPRASSWLVTMHAVVEAVHRLGVTPLAERAYELLLPYADRPMVGSLGVVCFGSVHHALGVASLTTGDVDRAVTHFDRAVRHNLALAHWPAVIASRRRLAEALGRRGRPQDLAGAARELATAAEEAAARGIIPPGGPRPKPAKTTLACTRQGRRWRIALGPRSVLVDHRIGMLHLAVLIANPGQEIDAVELAAGPYALGAATASVSSQPMLDRAAIHEYQGRIAQLRTEIDLAEAGGHGERAARAREERDWLMSELAATAGLGGRARRFADNRERARVAVGKAIRRAVHQVATADPAIGEHLARTVRTGMRCAYVPL